MIRWLLIFLVRVYQMTLSPVLAFIGGPGGGCRFQPTCSHYFIEAVEKHGVIRGSWFGVKRIARCHPWSAAGFDPVPDIRNKLPPGEAASVPLDRDRATARNSDPRTITVSKDTNL